ncbi:MAG: LON peptidase substrate-binding domain-containing protein [Alphaproteobacteria bacterium]|nr:LON peptidase substrate-binding domain-containing protein [Alphaproteobacteria bacterium]MCB9928192.1 LON peptidase substrate-binding domain-containing protein [Alphaproteobacteria bacterium]
METPALADLPEIVPIFPLPGVMLLPRAPLPLHIFEPRYRAMTRDALEGDGYIAMVQPSGEPGDDPVNPPVFQTAGLGRIAASERLEDGRYNMVLHGVCRLRLVAELPLKDGYRRVRADYAAFAHDLPPAAADAVAREALLGALGAFLERRNLKANWDEAAKASDEQLVNSLAMACPFGPREKQALLEAHDLAARAELLQALCELDAGGIANDNAPLH